ncbi:MAG: hypothetical protein AB7G80_09715 [Dongiaceae bacterium]
MPWQSIDTIVRHFRVFQAAASSFKRSFADDGKKTGYSDKETYRNHLRLAIRQGRLTEEEVKALYPRFKLEKTKQSKIPLPLPQLVASFHRLRLRTPASKTRVIATDAKILNYAKLGAYAEALHRAIAKGLLKESEVKALYPKFGEEHRESREPLPLSELAAAFRQFQIETPKGQTRILGDDAETLGYARGAPYPTALWRAIDQKLLTEDEVRALYPLFGRRKRKALSIQEIAVAFHGFQAAAPPGETRFVINDAPLLGYADPGSYADALRRAIKGGALTSTEVAALYPGRDWEIKIIDQKALAELAQSGLAIDEIALELKAPISEIQATIRAALRVPDSLPSELAGQYRLLLQRNSIAKKTDFVEKILRTESLKETAKAFNIELSTAARRLAHYGRKEPAWFEETIPAAARVQMARTIAKTTSAPAGKIIIRSSPFNQSPTAVPAIAVLVTGMER